MLVRSALSLVSVILSFAMWSDLKRRVLVANPGTRAEAADQELAAAAAVTIVILVLYVFLAFQVRKGANWARIVTWIIAGLGILGALVSVGQPDPPLSRFLGIALGVLDIAVVILLATGESNRFFRPQLRPH